MIHLLLIMASRYFGFSRYKLSNYQKSFFFSESPLSSSSKPSSISKSIDSSSKSSKSNDSSSKSDSLNSPRRLSASEVILYYYYYYYFQVLEHPWLTNELPAEAKVLSNTAKRLSKFTKQYKLKNVININNNNNN